LKRFFELKKADRVVVKANPAENIENNENTGIVFKNCIGYD